MSRISMRPAAAAFRRCEHELVSEKIGQRSFSLAATSATSASSAFRSASDLKPFKSNGCRSRDQPDASA